MSFDPTTFSFATGDESDLSDEQLEQIRSKSPVASTRLLAQQYLSDRTVHRHALAAYDKVYLPILHKLSKGDTPELVVRGDDVHALLYLCELGLLSAGVDPDRAFAVRA